MKIAVPTRDGHVDDHFGHCESYTVYTVGDNKDIMEKQTLPSPQGCGCKSNIASVLQQMGVTVMLAGNMGPGAVNKLGQAGIAVYRGCGGETDVVVRSFLDGRIMDSGEMCSAHGEGHSCGHDH